MAARHAAVAALVTPVCAFPRLGSGTLSVRVRRAAAAFESVPFALAPAVGRSLALLRCAAKWRPPSAVWRALAALAVVAWPRSTIAERTRPAGAAAAAARVPSARCAVRSLGLSFAAPVPRAFVVLVVVSCGWTAIPPAARPSVRAAVIAPGAFADPLSRPSLHLRHRLARARTRIRGDLRPCSERTGAILLERRRARAVRARCGCERETAPPASVVPARELSAGAT